MNFPIIPPINPPIWNPPIVGPIGPIGPGLTVELPGIIGITPYNPGLPGPGPGIGIGNL